MTTDEHHSHAVLRVTGIEELSPPGTDSNYLDWSFVLQLHLEATQTINAVNYRYVRSRKGSAREMWESLREAHQDSFARGRMYWLRKLILCRMSGDDVEKHIEEFDWLGCVSSLMNQSQVSSNQIVQALKQESLRRKSQLDPSEPLPSASRASASSHEKPRLSARNPYLYCTFCQINGHELNNCNKADRILQTHRSDDNRRRHHHRRPNSDTRRDARPHTSTKAGTTTTVSLGSSDDVSSSDEHDTTVVLSPPTKPHRHRAGVALAQSTPSSRHSTDSNLDSGCSKYCDVIWYDVVT
ncbi:hypothetical protein CROQUDRAFT_98229 [Cronartium quercuum f. sp. fusiforme G11]|uniref:Uncharacterized protein n=1 Tax=Cronartium quercuum f. sp. fusiforme G11 TaxID=708437 RepID=A0A9P6T8U7_9BASI|nr:hypothetical protein CROQUDRAFT_98229 [Cronartium quercuum f. sp. fusiforme G11]